jgi:hypothetical protein
VAPTNFLFKLYSIHNKKTQLPLTPHEINKKKKKTGQNDKGTSASKARKV